MKFNPPRALPGTSSLENDLMNLRSRAVIKVYNLRDLTRPMFEANSDLSNAARASVRFNPWMRHDATARQLTTRQCEAYDRIVQDPRYRHFVRIPGRIVRCLDYFQVRGDRIAAARILSAYYIFIAVVDNAIDSGEPQAAATVFEHLANPTLTSRPELSDVALTTRNLKEQLDDTVGLTFRNQLGCLYETVCQERSAVSIEAYIDVRKTVGQLTADLSYVLISPLLDGEAKKLRAFMQRVGAVGCLVDSVIDLSADQRRGLVSFIPTRRDHIKLTLAALHQGLSIGLRHPRLAGLFVQAILDNIRDRFITAPESGNGVADRLGSENES
jgi:hypothetical protein